MTYKNVYLSYDKPTFHLCEICGSIAWSTRLHDEWHDKENENA